MSTEQAFCDEAEWEPPRCAHGYILLGCPHDDCATQTAYLDQQRAALAAYEARQRDEARRPSQGRPETP